MTLSDVNDTEQWDLSKEHTLVYMHLTENDESSFLLFSLLSTLLSTPSFISILISCLSHVVLSLSSGSAFASALSPLLLSVFS